MTNAKVWSGFLESPGEVTGFHWDVLRPLTDEEFASLKQGIAEDGIVSSIVLDRDGNILDGGHRLRAWRELLAEGYDVPRAPLQIRQDIGSEDGNAARLLARKLSMQRRQLTQQDKRQVVAAQLRETWEHADGWIAKDLGVHPTTVRARRRELIDDPGSPFTSLPERVKRRDGQWIRYTPDAESTPSAARPVKEAGPTDTAPVQTTVEEHIEAARAEAATNGGAPEGAPSWPTHPSQVKESPVGRRVLQISAFMAGLSEFDPARAADAAETRADVDARLAVAEEVIDWFTAYRGALRARRDARSVLQSVK